MPQSNPKSPARTVLITLFLIAIGGAVIRIGWSLLGDHDTIDRPQSMSEADMLAALNNHADTDQVIGVTVDGVHRAYLLSALMRPDLHVYNDLVGNVPVTVSYCDIDDCVRVFSAPASDRPLEVSVGGGDDRRPRKMLLRVGSKRYWQDTGLPLANDGSDSFPYPSAEFSRTTWGEWRRAHPDAELFDGRSRAIPRDAKKKE